MQWQKRNYHQGEQRYQKQQEANASPSISNGNGKDKSAEAKGPNKGGGTNRNKRKRNLRPLTDKLVKTPASAWQMQRVVCIPLAESFNLEALQNKPLFARQFDTNPMPPDSHNIAIHCRYATTYKSHKQHQMASGQPSSSEAVEEDPRVIQEFYVFSDGVVVFWDISRNEQDHIIGHLKSVQCHQFRPSLSRSEEETMHIEYTNNHSSASDSIIYLNRDQHLDSAQLQTHPSNSPQDTVNPQWERFAFSHAMAASVRMGIWEQQLDELGDQLGECIERLKDGQLSWRLTEGIFGSRMGKAGQMIGQIASIRHSMNSSELLDTDIYWDLINVERVYSSLAGRLKLHARQNELNKRIDYCEDFSKTVHEMLNQKHSHKLEWIIIWLIALEVVINWQKLWELFKSSGESILDLGKGFLGFLAKLESTTPAPSKEAQEEADEDAVTVRDWVLSLLPFFAFTILVLFTWRMEFAALYRRLRGQKVPEIQRPREKWMTDSRVVQD